MTAYERARPPREIEADLDLNRARMSDTLDQLERKFSPGEMFEQAWNYARDKGNGEFASNLRDTIARNPLPIALVGLGLVWLAISGRRGSAYSGGDASYEEDRDTAMPADSQADARAQASDTTRDDGVATDLDEASPTNDQPGLTVYGDSSSVPRSSGAVAEGSDEASPTNEKGRLGLQGSRSSTSGDNGDVAKGSDKMRGADHRGTHVTLGTRNGPEDKSLNRRT